MNDETGESASLRSLQSASLRSVMIAERDDRGAQFIVRSDSNKTIERFCIIAHRSDPSDRSSIYRQLLIIHRCHTPI